jgi:hypothetical protein
VAAQTAEDCGFSMHVAAQAARMIVAGQMLCAVSIARFLGRRVHSCMCSYGVACKHKQSVHASGVPCYVRISVHTYVHHDHLMCTYAYAHHDHLIAGI